MDTITAFLISAGIVGFIILIKENAKYRRHEYSLCSCGKHTNIADLDRGKYCPECGEQSKLT